VVLDVAQLEALLTPTFSIGLDVGRGREKVALVRLRLSRALPGAAGTQAMAAGALAIERGVATEQIAAAGGWRCTPPRSPGCRTRCGTWPPARWAWSPAWPRSNPARAPGAGVLLDAALQAAAGLRQLLAFRPDCTTVTTPAEQAAAAGLTSAAAGLGKAAEALHGLIELAEMTGRSGRTGKTDLS